MIVDASEASNHRIVEISAGVHRVSLDELLLLAERDEDEESLLLLLLLSEDIDDLDELLL